MTARASSSKLLDWRSGTFWVAVAVLLGFGSLLGYMLSELSASEPRWSRLTYLYGTVEALAFAAAGALFGVHVQRERAENADARAKVAEQRASEHAEDATKGKVLASAVKAEALTVGPRGEAPAFGGEAAPELAPVARLATLADQLFPEQH